MVGQVLRRANAFGEEYSQFATKLVRDVAAVIDHEHEGKVVVVGHTLFAEQPEIVANGIATVTR